MPVQGLTVLSSAIPGIRDIFWTHDPEPGLGYHIYRASDAPVNWVRLTEYPVPGNYFRDMTTLAEEIYEVQDKDWVERGEQGRYIFKVPHAPLYGDIVSGRPLIANDGSQTITEVDGIPFRAARVDGLEGQIWLQVATVVQGGDRRELPLIPISPSSVVRCHYKRLANFVEPTPLGRVFYAAVPIKLDRTEAHLPGAPGTQVVNILEVDSMTYIEAEMVRRNDWLREFGGEPVHLMIRRTRGEVCGCLVQNIARTGCQSCFETGIIGGYYGPFDMKFIDPDSGNTTIVEEAGKRTERASRSHLGPSPLIQNGDMILRKNGERLEVQSVTYKSPRGVLLQQEYDTQLIPPGDTRYRVPLRLALPPVIYHPAFGEGNEPVSQPTTDPTKVWENPKIPTGRTVVFGNIET